MNGNKQQHTKLHEINHKEETQHEHHNKSCWSLHIAFQTIKQSKHITPKTQEKTLEINQQGRTLHTGTQERPHTRPTRYSTSSIHTHTHTHMTT